MDCDGGGGSKVSTSKKRPQISLTFHPHEYGRARARAASALARGAKRSLVGLEILGSLHKILFSLSQWNRPAIRLQ